MKTSNKILLATLLVVFGYLAIAQISLHAKYKKNDSMDPAMVNAFFFKDYLFTQIRHVHLTGLGECQVIASGSDSTKLSIEKSSSNYVSFQVVNDTLMVGGENVDDHSTDNKLNRLAQNIRVYVPQNTDISALNSFIRVRGNRNKDEAPSYRFNLSGCRLITRYSYSIDSLEKYYDTLSVNAQKKSDVMFYYNDRLKTVNAQLDHSQLNDAHAKIEKANIVTDSSSTLIIAGKNVGQLNTTFINR